MFDYPPCLPLISSLILLLSLLFPPSAIASPPRERFAGGPFERNLCTSQLYVTKKDGRIQGCLTNDGQFSTDDAKCAVFDVGLWGPYEDLIVASYAPGAYTSRQSYCSLSGGVLACGYYSPGTDSLMEWNEELKRLQAREGSTPNFRLGGQGPEDLERVLISDDNGQLNIVCATFYDEFLGVRGRAEIPEERKHGERKHGEGETLAALEFRCC